MGLCWFHKRQPLFWCPTWWDARAERVLGHWARLPSHALRRKFLCMAQTPFIVPPSHTFTALPRGLTHSHCSFSRPPTRLTYVTAGWPGPATVAGEACQGSPPACPPACFLSLPWSQHRGILELGPPSASGWRTPTSRLSCLTQGSRMHALSHSAGKLCCFLSSHSLLFCAFLAKKMSGINPGWSQIKKKKKESAATKARIIWVSHESYLS